jgi:hypothetical protein
MKITKLPNGGELHEAGGNKWWYLNGVFHREDGPSFECYNGDKIWHLNGKIHREDGPAMEYSNGNKEWFLNDKQVSQKEFKRLLRLKGFW